MLDKGKVKYSRVSIVQASDLKERLEGMKIKRDRVTIALVDSIDIYLLIKLSAIKKAVDTYSKYLTVRDIPMNILPWGCGAWLLCTKIKKNPEVFLQRLSRWTLRISMLEVKYDHIHKADIQRDV